MPPGAEVVRPAGHEPAQSVEASVAKPVVLYMPTAHAQPVASVAVPSLVDEPGHGEHVAASEIGEPAGP